MSDEPLLYLVATPIGNLGDISFRAVEILRASHWIACEDTRHSRHLLDHYGIHKPLIAYHEHNEKKMVPRIVNLLEKGESVSLISDAGTPLIQDPGFLLVRSVREAGIRVVPIPGPCAVISALSASGLATAQFVFEGFPPRKSSARKNLFHTLRNETRTLVFYESSHRIVETLDDLVTTFPSERRVVMVRELTKIHENFIDTTIGEAILFLETHPQMVRGEWVLLIEGASTQLKELTSSQLQVLEELLESFPIKKTVDILVHLTGAARGTVYHSALQIVNKRNTPLL